VQGGIAAQTVFLAKALYSEDGIRHP